ncbi:hypothetical protein IKE97_00945 [Candidatus Saccharibacteria bacterium]|nr:hypothetical protein [Candidatus Saccharibacteria bacterium]
MKAQKFFPVLFIFINLIVFLFASDVLASRGNLYTDTIVHCNGKTFGAHNGHWHEAKQNKKGAWYAAHPDDELTTNPCNASAKPVGGSSTTQNSNSNNSNSSSGSTVPTSNSDNTVKSNQDNESTTDNTSIEDVEVKEETETVPLKVDLKVWLDEGINPVRFIDNSYKLQNRYYWKDKLSFTYQLSSNEVSMTVEKNGIEVESPVELDVGDNTLSFKVIAKTGKETVFEVSVFRIDFFQSAIVVLVTCLLLIIGAGIIGCFVIYIKNKKKKQRILFDQFFKSIMNAKTVLKILLPPVYIAMKKRINQKISIYLIGWCLIWLMIIVMCIYTFVNGAIQSQSSIYTIDSPSASFETETIKVKESVEKTEVEQKPVGNSTSVNTGMETPVNNNDSLMAGVLISEPIDVPYLRKEYQPDWDVGYGCNIRARILQQTSIIAVKTASNGCTVVYGSWVDPYTGVTLTGNPYRGDDGTSNDLDIDHIIPLKYVNSHGGSNWSKEQKREYGASLTAMNKGVYVAVSASENRKKSDSGPSVYYPPNKYYRCEYAQKWRDIAKDYQIALSRNDYNTVKNVLASCVTQ